MATKKKTAANGVTLKTNPNGENMGEVFGVSETRYTEMAREFARCVKDFQNDDSLTNTQELVLMSYDRVAPKTQGELVAFGMFIGHVQTVQQNARERAKEELKSLVDKVFSN